MIVYEDEPLEVSILKKQLANLTCRCSVCEKSIIESWREESKSSNKEIQVEPVLTVIDQSFKYDHTFKSNFDLLCNRVSCPGCYIVLNLLKSREGKVLKDEETEAMLGFSCCDKASGKCVQFADSTTSTSSINPSKISCTSLCEKVTSTTILNGIMKKRSNEHVTFSEYPDQHEISKHDVQAFYGHCFCLQKFIESIRPPM